MVVLTARKAGKKETRKIAPKARKKKSAKLAFPQFRQKRNSQNRKIFSPIKRKENGGENQKMKRKFFCFDYRRA